MGFRNWFPKDSNGSSGDGHYATVAGCHFATACNLRYDLIKGFVVDKEIVFQMCVINDGTRGEVGGVAVSERTRICLTARKRHQVANDN